MKVRITEKITKFEDYEEENVIKATAEFIKIDIEEKMVTIQCKDGNLTICNFKKGIIRIWSDNK